MKLFILIALGGSLTWAGFQSVFVDHKEEQLATVIGLLGAVMLYKGIRLALKTDWSATTE